MRVQSVLFTLILLSGPLQAQDRPLAITGATPMQSANPYLRRSLRSIAARSRVRVSASGTSAR